MYKLQSLFVSLISLSLFGLSVAQADDFELEFDNPGEAQFLDRWIYPFNITPGSRINAPTFGAVGSEGFDERDGQFLIAVDTQSMGIESGLAQSSYQIENASLIITDSVGGYRFDGTYDSFQTYLEPDNANYVNDEDRGRPLELYGSAFRNDFEEFGWPDGGAKTEAPVFSAGSSFGPSARATRNVFAADAKGLDVSNNVDSLNQGANGFDPIPFAVAQINQGDSPLAAGAEVPAGAKLVFDINLSDADVVSYLQSSLSKGQLGFIVTSMHGTGLMGAGDPFPNPVTANHFAAAGPVLQLSVSIVDTIVGDFDGDGELTATDITMLTDIVIAETHDAAFDLTEDQLVDQIDRTRWCERNLLDLFWRRESGRRIQFERYGRHLCCWRVRR